jgi:hypothetical protein
MLKKPTPELPTNPDTINIDRVNVQSLENSLGLKAVEHPAEKVVSGMQTDITSLERAMAIEATDFPLEESLPPVSNAFEPPIFTETIVSKPSPSAFNDIKPLDIPKSQTFEAVSTVQIETNPNQSTLANNPNLSQDLTPRPPAQVSQAPTPAIPKAAIMVSTIPTPKEPTLVSNKNGSVSGVNELEKHLMSFLVDHKGQR